MYYVENLFENHAIAHISNIYLKSAKYIYTPKIDHGDHLQFSILLQRKVFGRLACAF